MAYAATNTAPSSTPSRCFFGTRGTTCLTSTSGTTLVARYPTSTMNARDDAMGTTKLTGVGFFRASSSESRTSAMTSSMTAAAMMSCPVGVPSTPPS